MGLITVRIDDALEKELREIAHRIYGYKKGSLSRAVQEAIKYWIERIKSGKRVINWGDFEVNVQKRDVVKDILGESKRIDEDKIRRLLNLLGITE